MVMGEVDSCCSVSIVVEMILRPRALTSGYGSSFCFEEDLEDSAGNGGLSWAVETAIRALGAYGKVALLRDGCEEIFLCRGLYPGSGRWLQLTNPSPLTLSFSVFGRTEGEDLG